jgi:hypothetical protein
VEIAASIREFGGTIPILLDEANCHLSLHMTVCWQPNAWAPLMCRSSSPVAEANISEQVELQGDADPPQSWCIRAAVVSDAASLSAPQQALTRRPRILHGYAAASEPLS